MSVVLAGLQFAAVIQKGQTQDALVTLQFVAVTLLFPALVLPALCRTACPSFHLKNQTEAPAQSMGRYK